MKRFWDKVDKSGDCWIWTAATGRGGYGVFSVDGRAVRAHRAAYVLHKGDIPNDMHVLHICDNPACVRIDHLFLGTHSDNMADKAAKGRQSKGSDNGNASLTEEDVRWIRQLGASQSRIAKCFGTTQQAISLIKSRKLWRHV